MTKLCSEKTKQNSKKKQNEDLFLLFFSKKGRHKKNNFQWTKLMIKISRKVHVCSLGSIYILNNGLFCKIDKSFTIKVVTPWAPKAWRCYTNKIHRSLTVLVKIAQTNVLGEGSIFWHTLLFYYKISPFLRTYHCRMNPPPPPKQKHF